MTIGLSAASILRSQLPTGVRWVFFFKVHRKSSIRNVIRFALRERAGNKFRGGYAHGPPPLDDRRNVLGHLHGI